MQAAGLAVFSVVSGTGIITVDTSAIVALITIINNTLATNTTSFIRNSTNTQPMAILHVASGTLDAIFGSTLALGVPLAANPLQALAIGVNGNSYGGAYMQNMSKGNYASTDLTIYNDLGTSLSNFIDIGINGSGFSSNTWTVNTGSGGYIFTSNKSLALGAADTTSDAMIIFFTSNTLASSIRGVISNSGLWGIGNSTSPTSLLDILGGSVTIRGPTNPGLRVASTTANSMLTVTPASVALSVPLVFPDGTSMITAASGSGGGGDNLGTHIATKTLTMNGFGLSGASSTYVTGTVSVASTTTFGLFTVDTSPAVLQPLVWVGTGTQRLFEVNKSSIVTTDQIVVGGVNATNLTATSGVTGASFTAVGGGNGVIQTTATNINISVNVGASSITVTNSSVSFNATSGLAINGLGIYYTTATGINLDAYRIQDGTATVAANATLTITPPNCGSVNFPFVSQTDGSATLGVEVNSWTYNGTSFSVKNTDVAASHTLNWEVKCK